MQQQSIFVPTNWKWTIDYVSSIYFSDYANTLQMSMCCGYIGACLLCIVLPWLCRYGYQPIAAKADNPVIALVGSGFPRKWLILVCCVTGCTVRKPWLQLCSHLLIVRLLPTMTNSTSQIPNTLVMPVKHGTLTMHRFTIHHKYWQKEMSDMGNKMRKYFLGLMSTAKFINTFSPRNPQRQASKQKLFNLDVSVKLPLAHVKQMHTFHLWVVHNYCIVLMIHLVHLL